ncbi:MAG: HAD family hydrolase [Candidatus Omnitrophota bacterium]|jgi:putative hydrolase of the HAD superfamily|nr:MAG: HAD family hydrolase [Candidatus Omnitrophota bacterium]
MKPKIKAITFDLWDTLFADDTDEPKRQQAGLPPKFAERRELVHQFLQKHAPISKELVDVAYNAADAAFNKVWHEHYVTWPVRERLSIVFSALRIELPAEEMDELIRLHEEMELRFRPDPAVGVHEAIRTLKSKYKLGVISDAIFSPGRALRQLLDEEGLLQYFDALIFSDEVGYSKPTPIVFEKAAEALGVELSEIVHIGDREQNDVDGPHAVGARAVFFTVVKNRGSQTSKADAICDDFSKLPLILEEMGG